MSVIGNNGLEAEKHKLTKTLLTLGSTFSFSSVFLYSDPCSLQGILPAGGLGSLPPCRQFGGLYDKTSSQILALRAEESLLL